MNKTINENIFNSFPDLESERLLFRSYEKRHAPDLLFLRSDPSVMKFMDADKLQNVTEAEKMIQDRQEAFQKKEGIVWTLTEKNSNQMIGDFGFWRFDRKNCRAEIGYVLKPQFWGKGYMKEAMIHLIRFAFSQLNVHSIEANVNPENGNSTHLLLRVGFQKEAHFRENYQYNGQFLDSHIFSLLEKNFQVD